MLLLFNEGDYGNVSLLTHPSSQRHHITDGCIDKGVHKQASADRHTNPMTPCKYA